MSRRRMRGLALNAEINVVSLIDVILLLLLIFMITAPMMTGGIDLQLPSASVQQIESRDAIIVEQKTANEVWVGGKSYTFQNFKNMLPAYLKGRDEVTFRGDASLSYGVLMQTWSVLHEAGVKGFGLMAIPMEPPGR